MWGVVCDVGGWWGWGHKAMLGVVCDVGGWWGSGHKAYVGCCLWRGRLVRIRAQGYVGCCLWHGRSHAQPYSIALNELFVECRYAERVPLFTKVAAMFHASPIFYSSIFVSTMVHKRTEESQECDERCGFIYHASMHEVDIGRRSQHVISCKASFLRVARSSSNHVNIWSPDQHWNAWMDDLLHYLKLDPSPLLLPHVHRTSTWCQLCDEWLLYTLMEEWKVV